MVLLLSQGRRVLIADSQVQRKAGRDFPIVLKKGIENDTAKIGVIGAIADRRGLRQAEQKIGQIIASAWNRGAARIKKTGGRATEYKSAAPVWINMTVELYPAIFNSRAEGMLALDVREAVANMGGLILPQDRVGVLKTWNGELSRGHTIIQRIWRNPADA